jgi:RNase P subunit RPR2
MMETVEEQFQMDQVFALDSPASARQELSETYLATAITMRNRLRLERKMNASIRVAFCQRCTGWMWDFVVYDPFAAGCG